MNLEKSSHNYEIKHQQEINCDLAGNDKEKLQELFAENQKEVLRTSYQQRSQLKAPAKKIATPLNIPKATPIVIEKKKEKTIKAEKKTASTDSVSRTAQTPPVANRTNQSTVIRSPQTPASAEKKTTIPTIKAEKTPLKIVKIKVSKNPLEIRNSSSTSTTQKEQRTAIRLERRTTPPSIPITAQPPLTAQKNTPPYKSAEKQKSPTVIYEKKSASEPIIQKNKPIIEYFAKEIGKILANKTDSQLKIGKQDNDTIILKGANDSEIHIQAVKRNGQAKFEVSKVKTNTGVIKILPSHIHFSKNNNHLITIIKFTQNADFIKDKKEIVYNKQGNKFELVAKKSQLTVADKKTAPKIQKKNNPTIKAIKRGRATIETVQAKKTPSAKTQPLIQSSPSKSVSLATTPKQPSFTDQLTDPNLDIFSQVFLQSSKSILEKQKNYKDKKDENSLFEALFALEKEVKKKPPNKEDLKKIAEKIAEIDENSLSNEFIKLKAKITEAINIEIAKLKPKP